MTRTKAIKFWLKQEYKGIPAIIERNGKDYTVKRLIQDNYDLLILKQANMLKTIR